MSTVKVRIDSDDVWEWSIATKDSTLWRFDRSETMEVDEELVNEYNSLSQKWFNLQSRLEQLYRAQEGLKTWIQPEIPKHVLLTGDNSGA